MANFINAPRPVDDPEHPRRENEPRDEIEMFIRDAYAAGCAAARNPGGALVAFEYANIHAPKLRALLTPSPDHADAGKVEGDGLPQDVINLVVAARDAFDAISGCGIGSEIEADLGKALEAFASRVPYENEPDVPSSAPASEGDRHG